MDAADGLGKRDNTVGRVRVPSSLVSLALFYPTDATTLHLYPLWYGIVGFQSRGLAACASRLSWHRSRGESHQGKTSLREVLYDPGSPLPDPRRWWHWRECHVHFNSRHSSFRRPCPNARTVLQEGKGTVGKLFKQPKRVHEGTIMQPAHFPFDSIPVELNERLGCLFSSLVCSQEDIIIQRNFIAVA
jgi:hypothetical protein